MSFDRSMALTLVQLAGLAYEMDERRAEEGSGALGMRLLRWNWRGQGNTHAGLWLGRRGVFVAFRGSNERADWRENLQFGSQPHGWGRVHGGFARALDRIVYELVACLARTSAARDKPLWLTGHSLGGALAVLMAAKCHLAGLNLAGIYTFGAPPAGDRSFARAFNRAFAGRSWRLVNEGDVVPRLLLPRYRHVNTLITLNRHIAIRRRCPPGQQKPCRTSRPRALSLPAHGVEAYLEKLRI